MFNFRNPLIALGSGLLSSSGPSPVPISLGQAISRGLLSAQQAQAQQEQADLQNRQLGIQEQGLDLRKRIANSSLSNQAARMAAIQNEQKRRQEFLNNAAGILSQKGMPQEEINRNLGLLAIQNGDIRTGIGLLSPPAEKPIAVSSGQSLINPQSGQVIFKADPLNAKAPQGYTYIDPKNPDAGLKAIPGGPAEKLSGDTARVLSNAESGISAIQEFKSLFSKDALNTPNFIRASAPQLSGFISSKKNANAGQRIAFLTKALSESIGRLQSGAAITADEEERFLSFIPKAGDTKETIKLKLDNLENNFNKIRGSVRPTAGVGETRNYDPETQEFN